LIKEKLNSLIRTGYRNLNYFIFTDNDNLLKQLKNLPYIKVIDNNYIYIDPDKVSDVSREKERLLNIFQKN
jgi:hypothetical protein